MDNYRAFQDRVHLSLKDCAALAIGSIVEVCSPDSANERGVLCERFSDGTRTMVEVYAECLIGEKKVVIGWDQIVAHHGQLML